MSDSAVTSTVPTIPPIPTVPLTDGRGNITREWWRWMLLLFTVAEAQKQQIDTVTTEVESLIVGASAPTIDPLSSPEAVMLGVLPLLAPGDPPSAPDVSVAVSVPSSESQPDIPPGVFLSPPNQPVDLSQAVLSALAVALPQDVVTAFTLSGFDEASYWEIADTAAGIDDGDLSDQVFSPNIDMGDLSRCGDTRTVGFIASDEGLI